MTLEAALGYDRVRGWPAWACSASRMPRCQSRASSAGVTEAWEQGPWVSQPFLQRPHPLQTKGPGSGSYRVPHTQLGSIEQQHLHGLVVAKPHCLVQTCVPFLPEKGGVILLTPPPSPPAQYSPREHPGAQASWWSRPKPNSKCLPCPGHRCGRHTQ